MSASKKYSIEGWRSLIEPALLPYGFKAYSKTILGRLSHEEVFQFIVLNQHRHTATFAVDVAIRPLFSINESHLTLWPGNRLGKMVTNGKMDTWSNAGTAEEAGISYAEVLKQLEKYAIPFFNQTRTSKEILESCKKNFLGQSRFKNQIEWGTGAHKCFDFIHLQLQAGNYQEALREISKAEHIVAEMDTANQQSWTALLIRLKEKIAKGREAVANYLTETIQSSKDKLQLNNWLPADIYSKLNQLFTNPAEKAKAEKLLAALLGDERLNISPLQIARSALVISNGDISVLHNIFDTNFRGDPRDLILEAVAKTKNHLGYFSQPFNY
ncbi:hypothetical protein [Flavihumibacter sp. CACIAM 22H1]|uniref:hypothetical protein n=1 Tax=Flavihumibacter sp. CACIAM 22H1 TaxID=1812911 RepID=UPI0007A846A5|nr:hypothetical protein [Flavihumibacter sp. CACIAM 22H1]KYP16247.1 MAG: hypothetical protein A1D16_20080 [Flavihumibacter sp. CACIAM 22H1]